MSRPGPSVHQLYKRLETVGRGAYGSVHKGIEIATGNVVALKIINLDTEDDDVGDIQREVALLTQLRDAPNVTKYYGCYLDGPRVWIVMEYAQGGSVRTLMKACPDGIVEEKYTVVVVREVLAALAYLHRSGIIHRDIKAANILITAAGKVMICDFGVSALLTTATSKRNTFIGTPYWMAPEVAQAVPNYDTKADIWSLGILIYEMAKGSPPHSNLDAARVLQLLPRTRAPRLIEGEGSKDMRDFIALCLKESSVDRLPAEELSKTKWIKTAGKIPNAVLKELLIRYDAWSEGGGTRNSLADPLGWEDEENQPDHRSSSPSDAWQFDTVKSMSRLREPIDEELSPGLLTPETPVQSSTIRPTQSSKVPVSLRSLFPEDSPDINDPPPAPIPLQYPPALAPPPLLIPTTPGQTRTARRPKRLGEVDDDDLQHTHRAGFVFPPRPKQTTDVEKPPEPSTSSPKVSSPSTPQYPLEEKSTHSDDGKAEHAQASPIQDYFRAPTERKRSKSSAADTNGHIFPSSGEYRFPVSDGLPISAQRPLHLLSKRSRRSPTLDSLDRIHTSPSHQSTHSLDAVPSGRTSPSTSRSTPNIARPLRPTQNDGPDGLHSESRPPSLKPNLIRQASVAVMETVSSPPLLPPVPPFVRQRQRSGNSVSGNSDFLSPNVPGLKDVLKVPYLTSEHQLGMADLLPPSPSFFGTTNTKTSPVPSPLNHTPGNNPFSPSLTTSLSASTKSASRSRSRSPPPPLDLSQPSPGFVTDGTDGKPFAPPIRPLDLGGLMGSRDDTHAELAHVVEGLAQWLAVVENGLSDLLAVPAVDTIEEEQEDLGGLHEEFSSGLEDQYETQNDILSTPHAFLSHSGLPT